jgi:hypothetical protein
MATRPVFPPLHFLDPLPPQPCTFFRDPTPDEIKRNPTQALQQEYHKFIQVYNSVYKRDRSHPFYKRINSFCSRDCFYYSLYAVHRVDRDGSIERFNLCAQQTPIFSSISPVHAAVCCYSKLLSNLFTTDTTLAFMVLDFLTKDYCMAKKTNLQEFIVKKNQVLYLILSDDAAYDAAPEGIKNEILTDLRDELYLRSILSMQDPNHPGVVRANQILDSIGHGRIVYSETNVNNRDKMMRGVGKFYDSIDKLFGQFRGGRKLKLKSRSSRSSRSSKNKSNNKNKNWKKTLRLRIKK